MLPLCVAVILLASHVNCQVKDCMFEVDGVRTESLMLTEPRVSVTVRIPPTLAQCDLRMLVVGGGGSGTGGYGGGGGSGHVQYSHVELPPDSDISFSARVGGVGQSSFMTLLGDIIIADAGEDAVTGGKAGDGYSGGGAFGSHTAGHNGGADGGDGHTDGLYPSGRGSGQDVSSYVFDNFVLSPGMGGAYWYDILFDNYAGGGGGGVLVNGKGPRVSKTIQRSL